MSFGYELVSEIDRLQEFPELGRTFLNTGMMIFAKSCFTPIESCTGLIVRIRSVRLHEFGIQREEFRDSEN
jgi:hypothetical protein